VSGKNKVAILLSESVGLVDFIGLTANKEHTVYMTMDILDISHNPAA